MYVLIPHHIHVAREEGTQFAMALESLDLAGMRGGLVAWEGQKLQSLAVCVKLRMYSKPFSNL